MRSRSSRGRRNSGLRDADSEVPAVDIVFVAGEMIDESSIYIANRQTITRGFRRRLREGQEHAQCSLKISKPAGQKSSSRTPPTSAQHLHKQLLSFLCNVTFNLQVQDGSYKMS